MIWLELLVMHVHTHTLTQGGTEKWSLNKISRQSYKHWKIQKKCCMNCKKSWISAGACSALFRANIKINLIHQMEYYLSFEIKIIFLWLVFARIWLCPCPSSVIILFGCHPWMRFFLPWMTFMDDTFIHGWDFLIHGWNCNRLDFAQVLQSLRAILDKLVIYVSKMWQVTIPYIGEQISSMDEIRECHPWKENQYPWMTSADEDDGWWTHIDGAYDVSCNDSRIFYFSKRFFRLFSKNLDFSLLLVSLHK